MTDRERYWMHMCSTRKDDVVIVVDNDCAYVNDIPNDECVFEFENFGWQLALDLFRHIGCNAEEA